MNHCAMETVKKMLKGIWEFCRYVFVPQWHKYTSETVVCLCGRIVEEFYDELDRICTDRIELTPGGPNFLVNVPAGQWHTVRALESGSVLLECKDGKYEPLGPEDILSL